MMQVNPSISAPNVTLPHGVVPLTADDGWGLIHVHGDDAKQFLHAQTTQDFMLLPQGQARFAAYCTPKGRMQASFVVVKINDGYVLLCRRDIQDALMKRLRMFVLRSKVVLEDGAAQFAAYGVIGGEAAPPWQVQTDADGRHYVALYPAVTAGGVVARSLCVQSAALPAPAGQPIAPTDWTLSEVLSGIANVGVATFEAFVPQMLNYESVDAIHFKKGCYPGQEVVARSQFRGAIKRRAYLLGGAGAAPAVGSEVMLITANEEPQAVGTVAAVANTAEGFLLLASLHNSALEGGTLQAGDAVLQVYPLPYALKEDI